MDIRLCFENRAGTNIDDMAMFRHYAENYLNGFDIRWAGNISLDHNAKCTAGMEPVWQYIIPDASPACRDYLQEYLTRNPMRGYHVHVFAVEPGKGSIKLNSM